MLHEEAAEEKMDKSQQPFCNLTENLLPTSHRQKFLQSRNQSTEKSQYKEVDSKSISHSKHTPHKFHFEAKS